MKSCFRIPQIGSPVRFWIELGERFAQPDTGGEVSHLDAKLRSWLKIQLPHLGLCPSESTRSKLSWFVF